MSHKEPEQVIHQELPRQKLRSAEPDLRVIVGQGDEKKEYLCHSVVLASHSVYIDTMLATSMKEKRERVLSFPDLDPTTWESMLKFLTDPLASRAMTVEDTVELAIAYDKYEFSEGRRYCDFILAETFRRLSTPSLRSVEEFYDDDKPNDLTTLIDTYVLANTAHLQETKGAAVHLFGLIFQRVGHSLLFTESQLKMLTPLIKSDKLLPDWTEEKISLPTFPRDFNHEMEWKRVIEKAVPRVQVRGCSIYYRELPAPFNQFKSKGTRVVENMRYDLRISVQQDDWIMYGTPSRKPADEAGRRIFWKCPRGFHRQVLPPENGWKKVDDPMAGSQVPTIKHIYGGQN